MTVNVSVYHHFGNSQAVGRSSSFTCASVAEAKKAALFNASQMIRDRIRYFYHVTGENIDVWFVSVLYRDPWSRSRKVKCKIEETYAPVEGFEEINKARKISDAQKKLKAYEDHLEKVKRTNLEWIDIIRCEKQSNQVGEQQLSDMRNQACSPTPYVPCPPPVDRSPEPGSLLESYYHWRSTTPNVDYKGPYVTIKMGSCGSGRYDPNTGKYSPHWHGG